MDGSERGLSARGTALEAAAGDAFAGAPAVVALDLAEERHARAEERATVEKDRAGWEAERAEISQNLTSSVKSLRATARHEQLLGLEEDVFFTPTEARPDNPLSFANDAEFIVSVLQPPWAMLPSAETRAAKLAPRFRAGASTSTSPRVGAAQGQVALALQTRTDELRTAGETQQSQPFALLDKLNAA
ncbi:hypothetical protein PENSPDRAFT_695193 [Peniophora sp. CONT]|nr:hypothetical protein PENSPDRAFT_695193 [Peniophora sp. CONT]